MTANTINKIKDLKTWCLDNNVYILKYSRVNGNKLRKDYKFYNQNIETFNIIDSTIKINGSIGDKIRGMFLDIYTHPKCPICDKDLPIRAGKEMFGNFCSYKCAGKSEEVKKNKSNAIKNVHRTKGKEVVQKAKATKLKRYGDENWVNKEKGLETWSKKHKDEKEQVKQKIKNTKLERYGDETFNNIEKAKETCLEKYGVDHQFKVHEVKEKIKNIILEKYGADNVSKSPIIKQKIKNTKLERYGDEKYNNIEKAKETCLEKYGVDNFSKSKEFKELIKSRFNWYSDKEYSNLKRYKKLVDYYTEISYNDFKDEIDPKGLRSRDYHLDHKYSKAEGFKNCIMPWIIGSRENLEMLPSSINTSKGPNCSHTLEELYEKFENNK